MMNDAYGTAEVALYWYKLDHFVMPTVTGIGYTRIGQLCSLEGLHLKKF